MTAWGVANDGGPILSRLMQSMETHLRPAPAPPRGLSDAMASVGGAIRLKYLKFEVDSISLV
jgi:hypothetical protein